MHSREFRVRWFTRNSDEFHMTRRNEIKRMLNRDFVIQNERSENACDAIDRLLCCNLSCV